MKSKNKIGIFFGPSGISAGWVFLVAGIVICWFSFYGILLIASGAFLAFSSSSVIIDRANKRIRPINTVFGVLAFGKWVPITNDMSLSVRPNNIIYKTYSRSNRQNDMKTHNFSIVLFCQHNNSMIPLKNFKSAADATTEANELSKQLGIEFKK